MTSLGLSINFSLPLHYCLSAQLISQLKMSVHKVYVVTHFGLQTLVDKVPVYHHLCFTPPGYYYCNVCIETILFDGMSAVWKSMAPIFRL